MNEEKNRILEALLVGLLDEYMENWQEIDQTWNDLRPAEISPEKMEELDASAFSRLRAVHSNLTGLRR